MSPKAPLSLADLPVKGSVPMSGLQGVFIFLLGDGNPQHAIGSHEGDRCVLMPEPAYPPSCHRIIGMQRVERQRYVPFSKGLLQGW